MSVLEGLKYSKDHEWLRLEDDGTATIGITDFAQGELGEIVYVEVETVGDTIEKDEVFGTVEAVKTTSDLFLPVSGKIIEFNPILDESEGDQPETINTDAFGEGWIVKIEIADDAQLDELMSAEEYQTLIS